MGLKTTNYMVQMAPLSPSFSGTPDQLAAEMVRRMRIVEPDGSFVSIYTGVAEPTSDVGPWLRTADKTIGPRLWGFNNQLGQYVPMDVSEAETEWLWVQDATPVGPVNPSARLPNVWIRTAGGSQTFVGVYFWNGTTWMPSNGVVFSGPTASRPAGANEYAQYFDTDISALIWWERGQWRTVSGIPGDVKFVVWETLSDAKLHNPGWDVLGAGNQAYRGRILSQATEDPGSFPTSVLPTNTGIPMHAALEVFGSVPSTDGLTSNTVNPTVFYPPTMALWCLVKL